MTKKNQKCRICKKEFTIKTLDKYGGICGKCNNLESKRSGEKQKKKAFFFSIFIGFFWGWFLLQSNPSIIPKDSQYRYFGDRTFADNEYSSIVEKELYMEIIGLQKNSLKKEGLKKLIQINPYKPLYESMLAEIPDVEKTSQKTIQKPDVTPGLITEIESWKFFTKNNFYFDQKLKLSSSYYGPGSHMNYNYNSRSSVGMEIQIKDNQILEGISLSNTSVDTAVELAQIFFNEINVVNFKEHLNANLNKNVSQIKQAVPFIIAGNKIYAGRVGWGNTLSFEFNSEIKVLPKEGQLNKEKSLILIKTAIEKSFISNFDQHLKKEKISKKYPMLANYNEKYNLLPETSVFLYYDGLADGPIYDKPGAKNFGAKELGRVRFSGGAVPAKVVAHKELEGNRNYFYVITNNLQGWMGRPYIMKNQAGDEFFMPNPLTGETARKELKLSNRQVKSIFRSEFSSFVPSYESISWDYRIPERYRREGYEMYSQALNEGYRQHQSLVNSYLSGTW